MVIRSRLFAPWWRWIALVLCMIAMPASAGASPVDDDLALETRIATIGYRLARGAQARCAVPEKMSGLILHDIGGYAQSDRAAIAKSLGLGDGFGVRAVVANGAAARAGVRAGDEIVAIDGGDLTGFARDAIGAAASFDRTERMVDYLAGALARGPVTIGIRRDGQALSLTLAGDAGCAARFAVAIEDGVNARADGRYIAVTSGLARLASRDDALAFAMAHEMAHILLGHVAARRAARDRVDVRAQELAADRLAVAIMADAGFAPAAAIPLLEAVSRGRIDWLDRDHPATAVRIAALRAVLAGDGSGVQHIGDDETGRRQ
ncbi:MULTISPECIES: M48 family metalloprotease [unclassified Sphingomonas]|uniref:M48 family metalloprotease n=1 Tax=unclassified Sphingomonas TaxID=196159 RepID=UPI0009EC13BE|nr:MULTISPECIES: M48 family metalloprotease [unclassified Sphingomonas]